jgi:hypothetical protein
MGIGVSCGTNNEMLNERYWCGDTLEIDTQRSIGGYAIS